MRRLFLLGVLGVLWCLPVGHAAAAPRGFAVLSFDESGKLSKGAGETLSMVLYGSMNPRRYHLVDPSRLRPVLRKHRWDRYHNLTTSMRKDLRRLGVRWLLTGTVGRHYGAFSATYRVVSMKGRILHNEVLPPVQSWMALVSTLRYSVRSLLRRSRRMRSARKKKKRTSKKGKKKKKRKPRKAFATLIKGAKKINGLFPLYVKKVKGYQFVYMEVNPKQLNKVFLCSPTLEGGTGGALITFAQLPEFPFMFKRKDNYLLMLGKNVNFRASKKSTAARLLKKSFANSLRAATSILSLPHPKRKSFLVSLKGLFMNDLIGLRYWFRRPHGQKSLAGKDALKGLVGKPAVVDSARRRKRIFRFIPKYSQFGKLKGFPKNVEIEVKAYYLKYPRSWTITPQGAISVDLRYSISTLPNTGYRPRYADDRVGYFLMVAKDYTSDRVWSRYTRYVTRWHLEKKYPKKKISIPKKPITFWLGNGIPHKHRKAVRDGTLLWNNAFERIGFRNAIQVKQQPDNAKWDGADVRYSTIRWFLANSAGFAQGPSRINPLTGQIYDADIRISADMVRFLHRRFEQLIMPMSWMQGSAFSMLLRPNAQGRALRKLQTTLRSIDNMPRHKMPKGWRSCDFARGALRQAALGWHLLQMRGMIQPEGKREKQFIYDFLLSVTAHEVGHTLGLRHNFKASTLHPVKHLHNAKHTRKWGLTNSVMEYAPVNVALPGQKQGEYWQTTLGPYDYWAIEYAYKPINVKTAKEEIPHLQKIASRVAEHKLAYGTDEDTYGLANPLSVDPLSNPWDMGSDPLKFYQLRVKLGQELWKRIEKKLGKSKKSSYQRIRRAFALGFSEYIVSGLQATKFVGGIYHRRDHIGDPGGRLPFRPVSAKQQRRALRFLINNFFNDKALKWSPTLLNKLAPSRMRGLSWMTVWGRRVDYPINRLALMVQVLPLYRLFHPVVIERIQDNKLRQAKGTPHLSIAELFGTVSKAVWSELGTPSKAPPSSQPVKPKKTVSISAFRRNLQRYHLELLAAYSLVHGFAVSDASSVAKMELMRLKKRLAYALPRAKDDLTRAHIQIALSRATSILKPTFVRWD